MPFSSKSRLELARMVSPGEGGCQLRRKKKLFGFLQSILLELRIFRFHTLKLSMRLEWHQPMFTKQWNINFKILSFKVCHLWEDSRALVGNLSDIAAISVHGVAHLQNIASKKMEWNGLQFTCNIHKYQLYKDSVLQALSIYCKGHTDFVKQSK